MIGRYQLDCPTG